MRGVTLWAFEVDSSANCSDGDSSTNRLECLESEYSQNQGLRASRVGAGVPIAQRIGTPDAFVHAFASFGRAAPRSAVYGQVARPAASVELHQDAESGLKTKHRVPDNRRLGAGRWYVCQLSMSVAVCVSTVWDPLIINTLESRLE